MIKQVIDQHPDGKESISLAAITEDLSSLTWNGDDGMDTIKCRDDGMPFILNVV